MTNLARHQNRESLDLDKIHNVLVWAEEGLKLVEVPVFYVDESLPNIFYLNDNLSLQSQSYTPDCFIEVDTLEYKSRCAISESKQPPTHMIFRSRKLARSPPTI